MKIDLLRTVIRVFALDSATRAMFREVGGFVYVMSVLMTMEGALKNEPNPNWKDGKDKTCLYSMTTEAGCLKNN